jgi:hypothetical protein
MAASTELNIILRDTAKTPLLRMTSVMLHGPRSRGRQLKGPAGTYEIPIFWPPRPISLSNGVLSILLMWLLVAAAPHVR